MANTFKSTAASAVGTTASTVYTVPASTTTTIIGLSVSNVIGGSTVITVDVMLRKGATDYYIIKGAPVQPGDSLVVVGGDQKLVAETGNSIKVLSSSAASADVIVSMLEVS